MLWRDAKGQARRTDCNAVAIGWHLRAETHLAELAGQRVQRAMTVVEGAANGGPSPLGVARTMSAAATAFEPGTASVTATLTVTWSTSAD